MSLTPLIRNTFYDGRSFQFGTIWTIADELLSIPDADRDGSRILHEARAVLIVANNQSNSDLLTPVITVAQLSHRTDVRRRGDVLLLRDRDGVRVDSIVRLRLLQPVLKVDLKRHVGTISETAGGEVLVTIEEMFGLDE